MTVSDGGNSTSTSFTVTVQAMPRRTRRQRDDRRHADARPDAERDATLTDADGLGAIGYQWFANGMAISGATGSTLLLGQSMSAKRSA